MHGSFRWSRRLIARLPCIAFAVAIQASLVACAGSQPGSQHAAGGEVPLDAHQPALNDAEFSANAAALLRDGVRNGRRAQILTQVVRYQLARAQIYFTNREPDRALKAVDGALLLIRAGELQTGLLAGTERTLLAAAAAVARLGDEGRAQAFYQLALAGRSEPAAQREIQAHLQALSEWQASTRDENPIQAAGVECAAASARALVDRSAHNVARAARATETWVQRAVEVSPGSSRELSFDIEDQREARYAKIFGSRLIIALHLRDGNAAAAREALEREPYAGIPNAELVEVLKRAEDGDAAAWAELYGSFESWATAEDDEFTQIARGASWGAALELFRLEPGDVRFAMPVAKLLVAHEAPDVAPVILGEALGERASARDLVNALQLVHRAMEQLEDANDVRLSRLVFKNTQPLLKLASQKRYLSQTKQLAASLFAMMGDLEIQDGQLVAARELLAQAVLIHPTPGELGALGVVAWQQGDTALALQTAETLRNLARQEGDAAAEMRGYELGYDVLREQGPIEEAGRLLGAALTRVLELRGKPSSMATAAAIERSLAGVLERYGELEGAQRAMRRAEEKASGDSRQVADTLLDEARRALTYADLAQGRSTLRRGLDAGLGESDLVYLAVWQRLLERKMHANRDGAVEEALGRVQSDESWAAALRDWIRGKINDAQLAARAATPNERIESQFYPALAQHVIEETDQTRAALKAIAGSAGVHLIEVRMARDLLSLRDVGKRVSLPPDIVLP